MLGLYPAMGITPTWVWSSQELPRKITIFSEVIGSILSTTLEVLELGQKPMLVSLICTGSLYISTLTLPSPASLLLLALGGVMAS